MKLHPFSIPLRALSRVGLNDLLLAAMIGFFTQGGTSTKLIGALIGFIIIFLLFMFHEIAWYLRFEYALTTNTLDIASGVISRRERNIPIRRVQTLDISQGPLARLVGVAVVDLETAGGSETEGNLRYIDDTEARQLQNEIQRLKQDSHSTPGRATEESVASNSTGTDTTSTGTSEATTPSGPDDVLFELSLRDLLLVSAVKLNLRLLLPITIAVIVGVEVLPGALADAIATTPGFGVLVVILGAVVAGPVATFARYYDFRLTDAGDELRYERGLFQRYTGSLPLEKLQTLLIHENVLERRLGYAALDTITAGYAAQEIAQRSPSAVPLGNRESLFRFARSIEGFDFDDTEFIRPPKRARRRYAGRYVLAILFITGTLVALAALAGTGVIVAETEIVVPELVVLDYWYTPLFLLPLVPVIAHLKWHNRGYAVGEEHVLMRNGFWNRGIEIVPYYRIQTVIHRRSLSQRRLGLATVIVDTAGSGPLSLVEGGARAIDIDAEKAAQLRETIRHQFRTNFTTRNEELN